MGYEGRESVSQNFLELQKQAGMIQEIMDIKSHIRD